MLLQLAALFQTTSQRHNKHPTFDLRKKAFWIIFGINVKTIFVHHNIYHSWMAVTHGDVMTNQRAVLRRSCGWINAGAGITLVFDHTAHQIWTVFSHCWDKLDFINFVQFKYGHENSTVFLGRHLNIGLCAYNLAIQKIKVIMFPYHEAALYFHEQHVYKNIPMLPWFFS